MEFIDAFDDFMSDTDYHVGGCTTSFNNQPWVGIDYDNQQMNAFIDRINDRYEECGPVETITRPTGLDCSVQVDAEVGDDHAALTDSPVSFLMELEVAEEILQVKISGKDTFISSRYLNFSEDYVLMPQNWSEVWQSESVNTGAIPFLDIPKIRVILPVVNQRMKFSDTVEGKVKNLSQTARFSNHMTRSVCDIALAAQYGLLGLRGSMKFPFFPDYLGGMGAEIPGSRTAMHLAKHIAMYKNGIYSDLLFAIASSVESLKMGDLSSLPFLTRCNEVVTSWRTWYTRFDKYLPTISGTLPLDYVEYQVGTMGKDPTWSLAASRLVALKAVSTESEVLVRFQMNEFTTILLSAQSSNELKELLSEMRKEMRAQTIFTMSWRSDWSEVIHAKLPEEWSLASLEALLELSGPNQRALRAVLSNSRIYEREAIDKAYQEGPMKVDLFIRKGNQNLPFRLNFSTDEEENLRIQDLLNWLRNPVGIPPTILLDDDPLLVKSFEDFTQSLRVESPAMIPIAVLFSEDWKLATMMNKRVGFPVILCSPSVVIEQRIEPFLESLRETYANSVLHALIDTGAISANLFLRPVPGQKVLVKEKFNIFSDSWRRLRVVNQEQSDIKKVFDIAGILPSHSRRRYQTKFSFTRKWSIRK